MEIEQRSQKIRNCKTNIRHWCKHHEPITTKVLRCKAKDATKKFIIKNSLTARSWCKNFLKKEGFSYEVKFWLPVDFKDKLVQFQHHVNDLCKKHAYALKNTGTVDETPLNFDMQQNHTVISMVEKEWRSWL